MIPRTLIREEEKEMWIKCNRTGDQRLRLPPRGEVLLGMEKKEDILWKEQRLASLYRCQTVSTMCGAIMFLSCQLCLANMLSQAHGFQGTRAVSAAPFSYFPLFPTTSLRPLFGKVCVHGT